MGAWGRGNSGVVGVVCVSLGVVGGVCVSLGVVGGCVVAWGWWVGVW